MARAVRRSFKFEFSGLKLNRSALVGALVGGEKDAEGLKGLVVAREGHGFSLVEGIEESLKLILVGVIGDVAGVGEGDREFSPGLIAEVELGGVELVVEDAAFAAAEVSVEVVGLDTIDHAGAFSDRSVFEFEDRGGGGGVLVFLEDFVLGLGLVGGDFLDFGAHAEKEGIESVATGGEE